MCSPAQLEANRLNAQKSTGPTSPEGKLRSSQNALKHGLAAAPRTLLPSESPDDYADFAAAFREDLNPQSPLQHILVDRIIDLSWRLGRFPRAESLMLEGFGDNLRRSIRRRNKKELRDWDIRRYSPTPPQPRPIPEDLSPARLIAVSFANRKDARNPLARLTRYESTLQKALHRALYELHQLQRPRTPTPPHSDTPIPPHSDTPPSPLPAGCHGRALSPVPPDRQNDPAPAPAQNEPNSPPTAPAQVPSDQAPAITPAVIPAPRHSDTPTPQHPDAALTNPPTFPYNSPQEVPHVQT